jgi:arsenite methyltransferase
VPSGSVFTDTAARQLDAVYQTPDVVAQRRETLRALAIRPGERVLDVGAGPGLLVAELAEAVGASGHVTGLDINPHMVALTQQRCAAQALAQRVSVLQGDATALPLADAAFDVAVSTQVYEYVQDLSSALAELHRVLRPGGRALILDTDWDSIVWHATDRARMRRVLAAWTQRFADPHLPATLAARLRAAGFAITRRVVLVLFNPEYNPDTYSVTNSQIIADFVVGRHGLTDEDVRGWAEELRQLGREGRYFFSLNRYLFLLAKPMLIAPISGKQADDRLPPG